MIFIMRIRFSHKFEEVISVENLIEAWKIFLCGKRSRKDVQEFKLYLMDNIFGLYRGLSNGSYEHGSYQEFRLADPKPRVIHKASVKDRLVHQVVYNALYPFFDRIFIADSYSCRENKGTHKALDRFQSFFYKASKNDTRTCWVLKCDIKKFFASVNHSVLEKILGQHISNEKLMWLLSGIIESFYSKSNSVGLPLGNLTSQLFVNVYVNEFDQYVKHRLGFKYYIRYADDFVFLSDKKEKLEMAIPKVRSFLIENLQLTVHKISLKTFASGIDYLGWVHFPTHRILRTTTKRRVLSRVSNSPTEETLQSYLGLLSHGDAYYLENKLRDFYTYQH